MEDFKNKKKDLIEQKTKLTNKMEKEKEKLISDFEKSFKKKEQVDANELIEEMNKSNYNNNLNKNEAHKLKDLINLLRRKKEELELQTNESGLSIDELNFQE